MKIKIIIIIVLLSHPCSYGELQPYRPATANRNPDHYNSSPEPEPTEEELATPPAGEIQKLFLRDVNQIRGLLVASLAKVPAGEEGLDSLWFVRIQAYKAGLDTLAVSRLQSDLFALIPIMKNILEVYEQGEDLPEDAGIHYGCVNGFSNTIHHAIDRHIIDQNGTVSAENLMKFITVFTVSGFPPEPVENPEDIPFSIDSPGILILNADSVVAHIKTLPWEKAEQFLGSETIAAEFFERYTENGNGLAVLKTKYLENKAAIDAKFEELKTWMIAQKELEENPEEK